MKHLSLAEQAYFQKRVCYWQEKMGQSRWSIRVIFVSKLEGSRAEVECRNKDGIAVIEVSKQFDTDWDEYELDQTAFHEVDEIKYWVLRSFLSDEICDQLIHEWIRTDENTWFKTMRGENENH
jgi:hypothetical protein